MYTVNYFEMVSVENCPSKPVHYPPYWDALYELHPGQYALVFMLTKPARNCHSEPQGAQSLARIPPSTAASCYN